MLGEHISDDNLNYFPEKIGFDISCRLFLVMRKFEFQNREIPRDLPSYLFDLPHGEFFRFQKGSEIILSAVLSESVSILFHTKHRVNPPDDK